MSILFLRRSKNAKPSRFRVPVGLLFFTYECTLTFANRRLEFQKRSQLFIGTHNETLSVVAMCVCDKDCSTARNGRLTKAVSLSSVYLKSEGDKRIRHYDADRNIIDLIWQLRLRGTCLIHINDYSRRRIVLERSKPNAQHSWSRHQILTILFQHSACVIERLLWKLE